MSGHSEPIRANLFHAGNTCPFCQEAIAEGQIVVTCNACGSLHHDTCWQHKGGCSSYHCDEKVSAPAESLRPDFVVTGAEVERVVVPPKPVRRKADEAARPFLPPKPARRSWLAILSVVVAVLSAICLVGVFANLLPVAVGGVALGLVAIVLGLVALVAINMGHKVYGTAPALTGLLMASGLVVFYFIWFETVTSAHRHAERILFHLDESRPNEEELGRMPATQARALRANVVITSASRSVFGGMSYGSGIVLKLEDRKAYVLTNRHVVGAGSLDTSGGRRVDILFFNGEKSRATVEWTAPADIDLVILLCQVLTPLKIEPPEILDTPAAQGDQVFAIGNPENLSWSYTQGVISSVRRQPQGDHEIEIYQTQTPINSGNSGGGLYDSGGRLVGINTWTKDKAIAEGLSFAISSRSFLKLLGEAERRRFLEPAAPDRTPDLPAGMHTEVRT